MVVGLRLGIVMIGAVAAAQVAAPHPASWGMLLIGFAAIGVASRADVRKLARVTV